MDPTAVVDPERVTRGLANPGAGGSGLSRLASLGIRIRLGWDAANTWWADRFSAYSQVEQLALLKGLGLDGRPMGLILKSFAIMVLFVSAIVLLYAVRLIVPRSTDPDEAARMYRKFLEKLERAGVVRSPSFGPRSLEARALEALPGFSEQIRIITDLYIAIRYEGREDPDTLAEFRDRVRSFRPAPGKGTGKGTGVAP